MIDQESKVINNLKVREARKDDLKSLWPLCSAYLPDVKNSSYEEFLELWEHRWGSPFRDENDPLGWVIENEAGQVKGFLGNIPLMFRCGDDLIKSYAPTTWVVSPDARGMSLDLFRAFMKFGKDAYLLDTTANPIACRVCQRLGMEGIRVNGYRRKLIWIVDAVNYLKSKRGTIQKQVYKYILSGPGLYLPAFFLKIYLFFKGSRIKHDDAAFSFRPIDRFGADFEKFWDDIKLNLGVVQERDVSFMNWRHSKLPRLKGTAFPFECKDKKGNILGYIVLKSNGIGEGGEGRLIVTDVLFRKDRDDVFSFMIAKAYEFARRQRAISLEFFGFNERLTNKLLPFNPLVYRTQNLTYWSKIPEKIQQVSKFWVSCVDGDLNL